MKYYRATKKSSLLDLFLNLIINGILGLVHFILRQFGLVKASPLHRYYYKAACAFLKAIRAEDHAKKRGHVIVKLRQLNPYVFEELLLICFKERGYKVFRNYRYTGDGGFDGKLLSPEKYFFLVQAKRYSSMINPADIKRFLETIQKENVKGGYFVHTGKTGPLSKSYLMGQHVRILSGDKLIDFILALPIELVH